MSGSSSVSLNEFSSVIQGVNTTLSTAFSDFVHTMEHVGEHVSSGALTEAQVYRNTAEWLSGLYQQSEAAARSAAQHAAAAGNAESKAFWGQRAQSLANTAAQRATMGDAAWVSGNAALDVRDSLRALGSGLATTAAVAGFAIEASQMLDAVSRGDWNRLGEVSTGMLGATAFGYAGMIFGGMLVAPVTAVGVVAVGVIGGAFAVLGHSLGVKAWANWMFLGARRYTAPRYDPLTLDLDGDGLETTGIGGAPVLFDGDGDGVKTGTGWLKGDDAFLALDKNGNGAIDNGNELFGVDTVLANGQKAADGFAALADLDSNHDGLFSSLDAQFANVRLWRDRTPHRNTARRASPIGARPPFMNAPTPRRPPTRRLNRHGLTKNPPQRCRHASTPVRVMPLAKGGM